MGKNKKEKNELMNEALENRMNMKKCTQPIVYRFHRSVIRLFVNRKRILFCCFIFFFLQLFCSQRSQIISVFSLSLLIHFFFFFFRRNNRQSRWKEIQNIFFIFVVEHQMEADEIFFFFIVIATRRDLSADSRREKKIAMNKRTK